MATRLGNYWKGVTGMELRREHGDRSDSPPVASPADRGQRMTREDLLALPAVLDLATAADVLGIGRTCAYELVRTAAWPTPVLRLGRLIRIPTAPLLDLLGIDRASRKAS
jgi:hypothetical protein